MPTTATNQPAGAKKPHARASVQSESVRLRSRNTEEYTVAQSAGLIVSTTEARLQLIAETAYQIAERRGLVAGNELDDGLIAEREIDSQLAAKTKPPARGERVERTGGEGLAQ